MPQTLLGQQAWAQQLEQASAAGPGNHCRPGECSPMSSKPSPLKRVHRELEVGYLTAENDSTSGPSGGATPQGSSKAASGTSDSRPPKRERVDEGEEVVGPKEESWAETLCGEVGRLSLADTACMLTVAIHAASGGAANPAALRQLVARTGLRLVRAVSPLHEFLERREHLELWSALPLEVVEVLLGHEELATDVEESVLEAAIFWLEGNADPFFIGEAGQLSAANRVLSRIRWGLLGPYALVSAWERSAAVRAWDAQCSTIRQLLAAQGKPEAQSSVGLPGWWKQRPCASGETHFTHTFRVAPDGAASDTWARSGQEVFRHGLLWTAAVKSLPGSSRVKLCLRGCHLPTAQRPVPWAQAEAARLCGLQESADIFPLAAPTLGAHLCIHRNPHSEDSPPPQTPSPRGRTTCSMAYSEQRCRVEGLLSVCLDLSKAIDLQGAPLTWQTLFSPACPWAQAGALQVTASVAMLA